jgi:hypothetical protein
MARHRRFNVDRFLDKFQGREGIFRKYLSEWKDQLGVPPDDLDVPAFKRILVSGQTDGLEEMIEGLYRAYDMCTERGMSARLLNEQNPHAPFTSTRTHPPSAVLSPIVSSSFPT